MRLVRSRDIPNPKHCKGVVAIDATHERTPLIGLPSAGSTPAKSIEQDSAISSLVLAYSQDPVMRWLYPEPERYLHHSGEIFREMVRLSVAHSTAYRVAGFAGGAFWLPPGAKVDESPLLELIDSGLGEGQRLEWYELLSQLTSNRLDSPHWYLMTVGLDPIHRDKGYGSQLIQPVLERCDADGIPAYLESSNPANLMFFRRHGFELLDTIRVGHCPPVFPMFRHPKTS